MSNSSDHRMMNSHSATWSYRNKLNTTTMSVGTGINSPLCLTTFCRMEEFLRLNQHQAEEYGLFPKAKGIYKIGGRRIISGL